MPRTRRRQTPGLVAQWSVILEVISCGCGRANSSARNRVMDDAEPVRFEAHRKITLMHNGDDTMVRRNLIRTCQSEKYLQLLSQKKKKKKKEHFIEKMKKEKERKTQFSK